MAVPTVHAVVNTPAGNGTSWALTIPSTVQDGDIIIVGAYKENSAAVTTPGGEGYADADPDEQGVANGTRFWSYWYKADLTAADASATHTFSWAGSVWRQAGAVILRGAAAISSQLDTNPPAAAVDTSPDTTAGTPGDTSVTADDLAVWFSNTFDSAGTSWPATNDGNTITERFDDTNNIHAATAPYATAGTVSAMAQTITLSGTPNTYDVGKTLLVKATGGGPPPAAAALPSQRTVRGAG